MENKSDKKGLKIISGIVLAGVLVFYASRLIILHFNQTMYPETGLYESDLYAHIEMALDGWGYSVTALIIRLFALLPKKSAFYLAFSVFLALCETVSIAVTYLYFRKEKMQMNAACLFALISAFVMPFYIRGIQPYRYIGYQSPNIWHNSTYIVMKICALLCVGLYLSISEKYQTELCYKKVIAFSLLLALTTGVKTNFILVFAPAALVFLVVDKILGVPWKRIILCALTVLPSIAVILFQKVVLFGEDTGNGIIIDPLYSVYLRAEKPYFTMILSALFPVIVFLINIVPVLKDTISDFKEKKGKLTHRSFLLSWSMWSIGFAELILLRETGERALDDNFAWGYDICLFFVFLVSIVYFVRNILEIKNKKNKVIAITLSSVSGAILLYHTYCGIVFFAKLLSGTTFFMQ